MTKLGQAVVGIIAALFIAAIIILIYYFKLQSSEGYNVRCFSAAKIIYASNCVELKIDGPWVYCKQNAPKYPEYLLSGDCVIEKAY